jgi:spore coat polysaccharide biosynthesis protein SpsF (cytidylyltransferase family)
MLGVIVQARVGSTRLPGKVLMDLGGRTVIDRVLERVSKIRAVGQIVVAIPHTIENLSLHAVVSALDYPVFSGSEHDVLDRYYQTAKHFGFDTIVRITADCPLLDPDVSTRVIEGYFRGGYEYYSNVHPPSYPDGLDTEVFSFDSLCKAWTHAKGVEREHVTPYIWKRPYKFRMGNMVYGRDLSQHRWTLDTREDYEFIRNVYSRTNSTDMDAVLALPFGHTLPRTIQL